MPREAAFAEQNLGQWQGMNRAAFLASRPVGSHWFADIDEPAPDGESFGLGGEFGAGFIGYAPFGMADVDGEAEVGPFEPVEIVEENDRRAAGETGSDEVRPSGTTKTR